MLGDIAGRRALRTSQHAQRIRRSASCPTLRGRHSAKSARLTREQRSAPRAGSAGDNDDDDAQRNLWCLMESAVDNLSDVIGEFQQGQRTVEYTNGDLAAHNGHLYIARNVELRFTVEAIALAASRGHLEMVAFLHETRKEGTTVDAMDLAATFGHLEVVRYLNVNRTEGCTTRAMDGAARNAHIQVSVFLHTISTELHVVVAGFFESRLALVALRRYLSTCCAVIVNFCVLTSSL